jgi:hypothetical protein
MSGVAGRSGRKMFVPTPEQRNTVRVLVGLGIPLATILGTPPPAGTVAIKDDRARMRLTIFLLKTKFGWKETG